MDTGYQIKKIREDKEISTYRLAEIVTNNGYKISQSAISKIENGKRKVSLDEIEKIAEALEVKIDDLLHPLRYQLKKAMIDNATYIDRVSPEGLEGLETALKIRKLDKENIKVLDKINDIFKHYGYKIDRHTTLRFEDMVKLSDDKNKVVFDVPLGEFYDYAKEMLKFIDRSVNSEIDRLVNHFKKNK